MGDGSDDSIYRDTNSLNQPVTIYTVAKIDDLSTLRKVYSGGTSNSSERLVVSLSGTTLLSMNAGTALNAIVADYQPHIHTNVFNTDESQYFLDGASIAFGPSGSNNWVGVSLFGNNSGTNMNIAIGEFLAYTGIHTQHQRALIENYLRHKWGFI